MRTYNQYCPIARTAEVLAERWTPLVVRNLMFGATSFSDISRGVPTMSRSTLVKRLRDLERVGVVSAEPKLDGQGSSYRLTDAGRDLATTIGSMAAWGERWLEVTSEHIDPVFALWAWCHVQLEREALPAERVVVEFVFPEEPPAQRRWWMLIDNGDAEMCSSHPGGDTDVVVTARSASFTHWHRGVLSWAAALRSGDIELDGRRDLIRALPGWNSHEPALPQH